MDRWLKTQIGKVVGPVSIEPWAGDAPPMELASFARIIDNENWRILVLGETLDLMPLLLEVGRIGGLRPLEIDGPNGKVRLAIAPPKEGVPK
jgi:hypothetical protein